MCARGGLSCRKRARADMESAPTFFSSGIAPAQRAVPRVELSPFVESEIRRGAFYMRPRRFILPQAGTGGYGIRPYVFEGAEPPRSGRCPACSFLPLSKTKPVGAHSICARGGLSCRKRARADMESAPTFFVAGGVPAQRGPRGAFLPVVRASGFILLYFIIRNLQKNDRLSSNKSRRFCRYFSGFVPKKCRGTLSLLFRCPSACAP